MLHHKLLKKEGNFFKKEILKLIWLATSIENV